MPTSRGRATVWPPILALLGVWAAVVPYLGPELGLPLDVASKVEFVDHVVPGAIAALSAIGLMAARARGAEASSGLALGAGGMALLAGVWMVSTHVPLLSQASRGLVEWGPALLHNSPGALIGLVSLWLLLPALRDPERSAAR